VLFRSEGSTAIADSRGSYVLFYKTFPSQFANSECMRLGWTEDEGVGWCYYEGPRWPVVASGCSCVVIRDVNGRRLMVVSDEVLGKLVEIEGGEGAGVTRNLVDYEGESLESDFTSSFLTREIGGSSETLFTRFDRGELVVRPLAGYEQAVGEMDASLDIDGDERAVETEDLDYEDKITFIGDCSGKRIQLRCEFSKAGFAIGKVEARIQTQDKRRLTESNTLEDYELELASNLIVWGNRARPLINSAVSSKATGGNAVTGTYSVVEGLDGRQSAIQIG